jgi:hypothetical protein
MYFSQRDESARKKTKRSIKVPGTTSAIMIKWEWHRKNDEITIQSIYTSSQEAGAYLHAFLSHN